MTYERWIAAWLTVLAFAVLIPCIVVLAGWAVAGVAVGTWLLALAAFVALR